MERLKRFDLAKILIHGYILTFNTPASLKVKILKDGQLTAFILLGKNL